MADAPLTVGDVLEVRYEGTIAGNRWNNVIHVAITEVPGGTPDTYALLVEAAEAMFDAWLNALGPLLSQYWVLELCRIKRIRPTASVFAFFANPTAGTVTGVIDEPDDAIVVRLYTSQAGRSRQGRVYIPGVPDDVVQGGYASTTFIDDLLGNLETFFLGPITFDSGLVVHCYVWSPTLSNDEDPTTLAAYPVVRIFADSVIRRQTRRDYKNPQLYAPPAP